MNQKLSLVILLIIILIPLSSQASSTQWSGNGHFYEAFLVPQGIDWNDANTQATLLGGYLATISSSDENSFVFSLVSNNSAYWYIDWSNNGSGPWLGGLQPTGSPEPSGNWQWTTGETWSFTNWGNLEPNNYNGIEDRLQFWGYRTLIANTWNDIAQTTLQNGFIVEWDVPNGILQVSPSDNFVSSGVQGGPFSPSNKTYTLSNTGGTSLNWTVSKTQSWIDLSETSGNLSSGASTTVTVSLNGNANSLTPETYYDTVTFTNTTNGNGNTSRYVTLNVTTNQCATFDFLTNTLHIPCFNSGSTSYWINLGLIDFDPITLELKDYGDNGSLGNTSVCASFDFLTNTFLIPCFDFEDTTYWLDLGLVSYEPILLELKDFGEDN